MAWVYIDDSMPDHPKIIAAGPTAAWLFVSILCWCRRHGTDGEIPLAQARRLADSAHPSRPINRLIEVGLIDPPWTGGSEGASSNGRQTVVKLAPSTPLNIHDWGDWNRSSLSRSEAGRKAAQARWGKGSERSGQKPEDTNRNADAYANASETHMPQDALSHPVIHVTSSSTTSDAWRPEVAEDPELNDRGSVLWATALAATVGRHVNLTDEQIQVELLTALLDHPELSDAEIVALIESRRPK